MIELEKSLFCNYQNNNCYKYHQWMLKPLSKKKGIFTQSQTITYYLLITKGEDIFIIRYLKDIAVPK